MFDKVQTTETIKVLTVTIPAGTILDFVGMSDGMNVTVRVPGIGIVSLEYEEYIPC
ncbi:MAG: hypothetical protein LUQ37_09990 [Methanoregulaceae archaeon]|jgi:hypothetical protein|nr:hypothetical protein [Methanoregulaceae archaeon]